MPRSSSQITTHFVVAWGTLPSSLCESQIIHRQSSINHHPLSIIHQSSSIMNHQSSMNHPSAISHHNNNTVMSSADNTNNTNFIINYESSPKLLCNDHLKSSSIITHRQEWITQMIVIIHESPKLLLLLLLSPKCVINFESSGQIIIFHQPRFPWNFREFPLLFHHHLGWKLVFSVVIIWPDMYIYISYGNLRVPPQCHPPPRNKALLRDY